MKLIKVYSNAPIRCLGDVSGPILTPFEATINTIRQMLDESIKVVEVVGDEEVVLDYINFDQNNEVEKQTKVVDKTETKIAFDKFEKGVTPNVSPENRKKGK